MEAGKHPCSEITFYHGQITLDKLPSISQFLMWIFGFIRPTVFEVFFPIVKPF